MASESTSATTAFAERRKGAKVMKLTAAATNSKTAMGSNSSRSSMASSHHMPCAQPPRPGTGAPSLAASLDRKYCTSACGGEEAWGREWEKKQPPAEAMILIHRLHWLMTSLVGR